MTVAPDPIIYLGLGRSDRLTCEALRGMSVLESFAYRKDYFERYRPTWAGAFLDSGAFTEMTQGVAIDLGEYIAFAQEHGLFYASIANLDDIRGDVDRSRSNHRRMLDAGVPAMPVFHQGEPWSVLDEVCAAAPEQYVGLGFQRPITGGREWLEEVFGRLPSGVRAHGFAMTSFLEFPFHSVDSATWVYEWKALMSVKGQGADALDHLTPGELLEIVMKKYRRLRRSELWTGKRQGSLFERTA